VVSKKIKKRHTEKVPRASGTNTPLTVPKLSMVDSMIVRKADVLVTAK